MRKKQGPKDLEQILRRRGSQQTPDVRPSVTEIRSCGVMGSPEPIPPNTGGFLGGVVIMWEYSVQFDRLESFHALLRNSENHLVLGLPNLNPGASYLGTYMMHAGGTPRYRTIWAYSSMAVMAALWAAEVAANGNVAQIVKQLRAFWLRDSDRTEARWIPARLALTEDDSFAKLTIQAQALV